MVKLSFNILGNASDPEGNPMPKIKLTKGQQWTSRAQEYARYKDHVRAALMDAFKNTAIYPMIVRNIGVKGKPLTTTRDQKGTMRIFIRWASDIRGDSEGIFGAIADALFTQDKYLVGAFDYEYAHDRRGSVEVVITLENKKQ